MFFETARQDRARRGGPDLPSAEGHAPSQPRSADSDRAGSAAGVRVPAPVSRCLPRPGGSLKNQAGKTRGLGLSV